MTYILQIKETANFVAVRKIMDGSITLFTKSVWTSASMMVGENWTTTPIQNNAYYYYKEDIKNLPYLNLSGFFDIGISKKKAAHFFTDCPLLVSKIKNKEIKRNAIPNMVEIYNNNCN